MKTTKAERARIISDMSECMLQHGDNCTRETLLLQFSQHEIDAYAPEARAAANDHLKRAA